MNLGIIGLPCVGKKTIFRILTATDPAKAQCRSEIRYGIAPVKDTRIDRLTDMYTPKRTKYAEFDVALPPDLKPDSSRSASWLDPLRNMDALIHVVRAFDADHVFHTLGSVDPERDVETVDTELLFADLELAEKRLTRMNKERSKKDPASKEQERLALQRCQNHLEAEQPLRTLALNSAESEAISSLKFFTLKPQVVVINTSDAGEPTALAELTTALRERGAEVVTLCASLEAELVELEDEDRAAFMAELEIEEPAAHQLSTAAFACLGLISFFTVGPDEVRAWPITAGSTAPTAAGKIHSDLERGFIRAETIAYEDLAAAGDEKAARQANHYRLNGKDYVVRDGDILNIRFNV